MRCFKFIFIGILIAAISSCKEPVSGIILDPSDLIIGVGQTATLTVTFLPYNATNTKVSWESSDKNVATVDNGKVIGKAVGRSTITVIAQDGGRTAKCWVYVIQPIEPEEMIWVEGGTFIMGCTEEQGEDCFDGARPSHQLTLSGFYIGKYIVTQKEWVAGMGYNPSYDVFTGDNIPVHCIAWIHAQEYISALNAYTGKKYRLPTEAEWEYAARGGNKSEGYMYSGSNYPYEVGWYSSDSRIFSVGLKKPNELGIYDMSGNVWEFCSDWIEEYTDIPQTNPVGPATGDFRVIRGGSMSSSPICARVSYRACWAEGQILCNGGFRLVLDKE